MQFYSEMSEHPGNANRIRMWRMIKAVEWQGLRIADPAGEESEPVVRCKTHQDCADSAMRPQDLSRRRNLCRNFGKIVDWWIRALGVEIPVPIRALPHWRWLRMCEFLHRG